MSRHERMHMLQANPSIKPLFMVKPDVNEPKKTEENQANRKDKAKGKINDFKLNFIMIEIIFLNLSRFGKP